MVAKRELTERERLQWIIEGIRTSTNKTEAGCFYDLEHYMYYPVFNEFDLDANQDLWKELKRALKEHPLLEKREEVHQRLNRPAMAEKGYWWFDSKNWH